MAIEPLDFEVCLEVSGLQAVLDGGNEAACVRTVNYLVIVGEWQVAHLADSDGVLAILVDNCLLYTSPSPRDS